MPITIGKIELYFGPVELGQPDNLETVIIDFIISLFISTPITILQISGAI